MLVNDRDSARGHFIATWESYKNNQPLEPLQELILGIILEHPEYHAILDKGKDSYDIDYSPELGQTNPFLHMGMHIAIREQLQANHPMGIKELYDQLLEKTSNAHKLEHKMMECLGEMLWQAQRDKTLPDETKYLESLRNIA